MVYVPKYNGFIADVANIDFKRCDGKVYTCQHATATSMTPSADSISITGGHSQYPIGFIDTARGLEATFTNAMFDMDMFEIANAGDAVDGEATTCETKKFVVTTGPAITMDFEVEASSVYIRGLTNGASVASGTFQVQSSAGQTTITFAEGDVEVGDEVNVFYERKIAEAHTIKVTTTTPSARGEVWYHWPVYSSGTDCTEAAIKGWVHIHVFRVRVTALPGIDSSYKTAATFPMTFTAIDPGRADGMMQETVYEELTA